MSILFVSLKDICCITSDKSCFYLNKVFIFSREVFSVRIGYSIMLRCYDEIKANKFDIQNTAFFCISP